MIAVFVVATLLPYVAAGWLIGSDERDRVTLDRYVFDVVIVGTGALYSILNILAFAGVMSIPAVAACSGAAAVAAWVVRHARLRRGGIATDAGPSASPVTQRAEWWTERVPVLVVAVICGVWILQAAAGLEVVGADADHYHIPQAANFALGASPWGLRATPHTYPMGTSVLFAWFIVPFGDAFLIEAGMLIWFLVLLVSVAALFRELTGLSGWTWGVWFGLIVTALPIVHAASWPSSDLPYAASFVAVAAQLTWMVNQRTHASRDWAVLGLSLGLLVGCKTSGTYSAAMLLGAAAFFPVIVWRSIRWRARRSWIPAAVMVSSTGLLAGGIWLIRNTFLFGQPVEIVTDRYYGSVLSELKTTYGGDWWYLLWRVRMKFAQWLGPNFLLAGYAMAWLVLESAWLLFRRRADRITRVRAWFLGLMTLVVAVHLVGLVGAPWTGLEWTGGRSLRYALPLWIVFALVAYVALFSRWIRWYERPLAKWIAWVCLAGGAVWITAGVTGLGGFVSGEGFYKAALAAGLALAVVWAVAARTARLLGKHRHLLQPLVSIAVLAAVAVASGAWLSTRHATLRADGKLREYAEFEAWRGGVLPREDPLYRQVFLEVRADELRRGDTCQRRRFFIASRFDAPLALQPARYTSVLFESRWNENQVTAALRGRGEPGTCDYVVVSREDAGRRTLTVLGQPVGSKGPFLSYRVLH